MLTEKNTIYDGFGTLERGMDSGRAASLLPPNQASFLINAQTRSGYVENRPGWSKLTLYGDTFQLGRWQGASPYISASGQPYLVASIGGYIVRFDLINQTVLVLSDAALNTVNASNQPRAWFVQAETFLCIQDNSSLPLIFDGASLRRGVPVAFGGDEFPVGNIMEYNNGRLWVALPDRRSFVGGDLAYSLTGDASDVLKSTQNEFLTSGSFALPATAGFITAMRSIANQDSVLGQGPLIVFGQYGAATVNAPFNADQWQNSDSPIVSLGLLSQGPTGQDACLNVNGDLWYRSRAGICSFMIARRDHGTWVNTPLSHEMDRVLIRDDPYLTDWVSGVDFDNRLLMTCSPYRVTNDGVQYGTAFRGLSALDFTRVTSMFDRTQPTWEGIWNGLAILQILTVNCYGKDRCFMFVLNDCFQIELWELSRDDRFDNLTDAIQWSAESRAFGFEDQSNFLKQLVRTETWLERLAGTVTYAIRYRPDGAPEWQTLDAGAVCATTGMCAAEGCAVPEGPFPQYRARKISSGPSDTDCEECNQKQFRNGFEYQFQLEFTGAARVRRFRAVATNVPEEVTGGCLDTEECCEEAGCGLNPWEYQTESTCVCALAISTQPVSQELEVGDTLVLSVAASGSIGELSYQWYLDGVALVDGSSGDAVISGATTASLVIANITEALAGDYTVIVTDSAVANCAAESDPATVGVSEPPAATNTISLSFFMEMLTQPDPAGADILSNYDFELWDAPAGSAQSRIRLSCAAVGGGGDTYTFDLTVSQGGDSNTLTSSPVAMPVRTWHHVVIVYEGSTGLASLYVDTVLLGTTSGTPTVLTTQPYGYLNMTGAAHTAPDYLDSYVYMQDLTGVWVGHALTSAERAALYNSGNGLNGPPWTTVTAPTAWWDFDDAGRTDGTSNFVDSQTSLDLTPSGSIGQLEGLINYGVIKTGFTRTLETAVTAVFAYTA